MHLPINVKSPNDISKWQVGFNSAFEVLIQLSVTQVLSTNAQIIDECGMESEDE
jgi:hypothetical protein